MYSAGRAPLHALPKLAALAAMLLPAVAADAAPRLVSLSPDATLVLVRIGAGEQLVELETGPGDRPADGCRTSDEHAKPLVAAIARQSPDAVIIGCVPPDGEVVQRLAERGIETVRLAPRSTDEVFDAVRALARLAGRQADAEPAVHGLMNSQGFQP